MRAETLVVPPFSKRGDELEKVPCSAAKSVALLSVASAPMPMRSVSNKVTSLCTSASLNVSVLRLYETCHLTFPLAALLSLYFDPAVSRTSAVSTVLLAGENKIIARHRGLWQYTEGQRRGLRIAWKEPLYVLKRLREENTLVVGPKHVLPVTSCSAGELNLMVAPHLWPEKLFVRVRYHQAPVPADVTINEDRMHIAFASPQQPPAPGQVAAVYDGEGFVLAGGVLD